MVSLSCVHIILLHARTSALPKRVYLTSRSPSICQNGSDQTILPLFFTWDQRSYECMQRQSLGTRTIEWKLFNGPDSTRWNNILTIVELLFCTPVSNGQLERMFLQLNLIGDLSLGKSTHNLLRINVEAPTLEHWDATGALNLWWKDKTRRLKVRDRPPGSASTHTDQFEVSDRSNLTCRLGILASQVNTALAYH